MNQTRVGLMFDFRNRPFWQRVQAAAMAEVRRRGLLGWGITIAIRPRHPSIDDASLGHEPGRWCDHGVELGGVESELDQSGRATGREVMHVVFAEGNAGEDPATLATAIMDWIQELGSRYAAMLGGGS